MSRTVTGLAKADLTTHDKLNPMPGQRRELTEILGPGLAGHPVDLTAPGAGRLDSGKRARAVPSAPGAKA
jgi:hypothetical protein